LAQSLGLLGVLSEVPLTLQNIESKRPSRRLLEGSGKMVDVIRPLHVLSRRPGGRVNERYGDFSPTLELPIENSGLYASKARNEIVCEDCAVLAFYTFRRFHTS
jgi:hypothetical protein